jgi:hypothetical protein
VVRTTGPCTGAMGGGSMGGPAQDLILTSNGAGTCQVELTFSNGDTSSLNVVFVSQARPYDDCDPNFIAVNDAGIECIPGECQLSIQAPCDAGPTSAWDASSCTVPITATTLDGGWGCQPDPSFQDCTAGTCVPPCITGQYALLCVRPSVNDAGQSDIAPPPPPPLNCVSAPTLDPGIPFSQPLDAELYCCPCGS